MEEVGDCIEVSGAVEIGEDRKSYVEGIGEIERKIYVEDLGIG